MRPQLPAFFRRLDRHLLESFPVLWILRLHYVLTVWLAGLALLAGLAVALPIRYSTVLPFSRPYWLILGATILLAASWIYRLARLSPALRNAPRPYTGVLLLAAYLGISALFLLWPVVFYRIFEQRIADAVTAADETLLQWDESTDFPKHDAETFLQRFGAPSHPRTLKIRTDGTLAFSYVDSEFLNVLKAVKHPTPERQEWLRNWRTSKVFRNPGWGAALVLLALSGRVAQIVRREHVLALLAAVFALVVAWSATFLDLNILAVVLLAYLGIGAVATFGNAGDRRRVNLLLSHLAAMFYFLHPCAVLFAEYAGLFGDPTAASEEAFRALALGLVLLFALAPFVERRLASLAAAPH